MIKKTIFYIVGPLSVVLGGICGIFVAMGICVSIWGADILKTALGKPPEYDHPAFWIFMLLLLPCMIFGFAGPFFLLYLPAQLFLGIPFSKSDIIFVKPIRSFALRFLKSTEE